MRRLWRFYRAIFPCRDKNNGQLFWGHPLKDVLFSSLDKWEFSN